MENNYFFIDGSTLLSDIKKLKINNEAYKNKKFDLQLFSDRIFRSGQLTKFHGGSYKRTVFYFVKDDTRIKENVKLPIFEKPNLVNDLEVRFCGKKITTHKKATKWLKDNQAPGYVVESLYKSEKATDFMYSMTQN